MPFESLYIHVPFCHGKCDYCAFYSLGEHTPTMHQAYLKQLAEKCRHYAPQCGPLQSVFIGGGTPSALSPEELAELLSLIRTEFQFAKDCEFSIEANPDSLSNEHIDILSAQGVNRVSLGVQTTIAEERVAIGRRGRIDVLPTVVGALHSHGITNLNFDLMYQLPTQTPASFERSLTTVLQFNPTHISTYALTLDDSTPLARRMAQPSDVDFMEFWDIAERVLTQAGFKRYEISNFARSGHICRHNNDIWHGATYLGLGPAATSFDGAVRFTQPPSLQDWLDDAPPERDELSPQARACEILAFGMRTIAGWNWRDFMKRTGFNPVELRGPQLNKLSQLGLLDVSPDGARPTPRGLLFNDDVLMELI